MIVNNRVVEYINSLEKDQPIYLQDLAKTAINDDIPIIKKETGTLLRFLISLLDPKNILEIGTATGFSAIFMSEYMSEESTITTIEKSESRIEQARINLSSSPKGDKITLLEGDAAIFLEEFVKDKDKEFDFIFLDAAKGQYINFLPNILKLLKKGGILVTDNVLQDGDIAGSRYAIRRRDRTIHSRMREYLYTLTHTKELETVILPIGDGVTLSTKKKGID